MDDGGNYSLFYSLPLTRWDTTLDLGYNQSDYVILEEPFNTLDIESDTRMYSVALRQPIYRDLQHELSLTSRVNIAGVTCWFPGSRFRFRPARSMDKLASLHFA